MGTALSSARDFVLHEMKPVDICRGRISGMDCTGAGFDRATLGSGTEISLDCAFPPMPLMPAMPSIWAHFAFLFLCVLLHARWKANARCVRPVILRGTRVAPALETNGGFPRGEPRTPPRVGSCLLAVGPQPSTYYTDLSSFSCIVVLFLACFSASSIPHLISSLSHRP